MNLAKRLFVTGTDTGVGKTRISALLMMASSRFYWKPMQTGVQEEPSDTQYIQHITALPKQRFIPEWFILDAPFSPQEAARREGKFIDVSGLSVPTAFQDSALIIEGAGGVLVPITDEFYIIDLIKRLQAEVLLVARSSLGTINHTLLSLEALRQRQIPIRGVVMNGEPQAHNARDIERHGNVEVLAQIPPFEPDMNALVHYSTPFRSLFKHEQ